MTDSIDFAEKTGPKRGRARLPWKPAHPIRPPKVAWGEPLGFTIIDLVEASGLPKSQYAALHNMEINRLYVWMRWTKEGKVDLSSNKQRINWSYLYALACWDWENFKEGCVYDGEINLSWSKKNK